MNKNNWNRGMRFIKRNFFRKFQMVLLSLGLITSIAFSNTNSAEIIADTLAGMPACLHYEIKGACFWLSTTGAIVSTPYVQHYLPDAVVSVFNQPDQNPWLEIEATLDQAAAAAQSGLVSLIISIPAAGGQHSFHQPFEQHVYFKEVDILGNPAIPVLPTTPVLLHSVAVPLQPYFQSMLDSVLWRGFPPMALPEQAMAYAEDITHTVGKGATVWGGAYPFEGKIITGNDAKAGAVIAQRAADLLTASNAWGHLYQPLSTNCGVECQAAVIQENNSKTQFQKIYPNLETTCSVFGASSTYGENAKTPDDGAYVWVLWRQYRGCVPAPGCTFINKVVM
jgi:integrating conjugative element protein (TIGR03756 family)